MHYKDNNIRKWRSISRRQNIRILSLTYALVILHYIGRFENIFISVYRQKLWYIYVKSHWNQCIQAAICVHLSLPMGALRRHRHCKHECYGGGVNFLSLQFYALIHQFIPSFLYPTPTICPHLDGKSSAWNLITRQELSSRMKFTPVQLPALRHIATHSTRDLASSTGPVTVSSTSCQPALYTRGGILSQHPAEEGFEPWIYGHNIH